MGGGTVRFMIDTTASGQTREKGDDPRGGHRFQAVGGELLIPKL